MPDSALNGLKSLPAGVIAATHGGRLCHVKASGQFADGADVTPVTPTTVFDLASLTKVLATTAMAMLLHDRGHLHLDQPVREIVPEFSASDLRRERVTLRMLLAHSSGLPAHERYFERWATRDELLRAVMQTPLAADPMSRAEYSDIGFIILGVALERLAGEPLDVFCEREVFSRLGMTRTCFNPPQAWRPHIPPTRDDDYFRHRVIQGEVNDENAYVLGGVAPHAGLFASAEDVARFALCMLRGGEPLFGSETVQIFTQRQAEPAGTTRALGWDTPSSPSQSGKYFSPGSFGHLGYTGTSLWIDPVRDVSITLLSNRTWPDAQSQAIKQVRPALHDAMMEVLFPGIR